MDTVSEYIWYLKFKNANLEQELRSYKSGNKFQKLRQDYEAVIRAKDREIRRLQEELARSHAETVTVRKYWNEIFDDVDAERKRAVLKAQGETIKAEKNVLASERKIDELTEKLKRERKEKYAMGAELEEVKNLNQKLTAQINKDFENSSIPSSMQRSVRKKITNGREPSGKKRGAQPGHKGAKRKKHTADETVMLDTPDICLSDPDYYKTSRVMSRQLVEISIAIKTTEYKAEVWRNRKNGSRIHAPFPEGVVNEVNYGGSVKALAFLLGNECNVSHPKVKKFISEITSGRLELSTGFINGLCEELSAKTENERNAIIEKLMASPAMNADFTNANVNGNSAQVLVLASEQNNVALYIARESKGHKGIQGTPLENYVGTVIHDHDTTFYSYGLRHQECHQHNIRYAKGSMENEPDRKWNIKMLELIRGMLHYRNNLGDKELDTLIVGGFEKRYDEILDLGEQEYLDVPPTDYYREGYNLCKRLRKYKESELLFLHDKNVPANNSLCERLARVYKRKQKQAMVLRSFNNFMWLCDSMSIVYLLRQKDGNTYEEISDIYRRKRMRAKLKKNNNDEISAASD